MNPLIPAGFWNKKAILQTNGKVLSDIGQTI